MVFVAMSATGYWLAWQRLLVAMCVVSGVAITVLMLSVMIYRSDDE